MTRNLCPSPSWHILPVFLGVTSLCGMVVTYILAKQNCHVEKWFLPYISHTGTEHPESSVFGLILNTEGFLGIVVVILAWRFMQHLKQRGHLNTATLVAGIISCFGVIMVGNFQVSKTKVPHYVGAGLAFIVGTVYCTMSSVLTHRLHKSVKKRPSWSMFVCMLRFTTAGSMIISILILIVLAILRSGYSSAQQEDKDLALPQPHLESEPIYRFPNGSCVPIIDTVPVKKRYLDLAGSITEWILTGCLLFSLSLYAYEFKHFHSVKIILKKRGTELNIELLQRNHCKLSPQHDRSCYSASTNASLPHSDSDTTLLHPGKIRSNRSSVVLVPTDKCYCKNNNKDSCVNESEKTVFDTSKSMPNIASLDLGVP